MKIECTNAERETILAFAVIVTDLKMDVLIVDADDTRMTRTLPEPELIVERPPKPEITSDMEIIRAFTMRFPDALLVQVFRPAWPRCNTQSIKRLRYEWYVWGRTAQVWFPRLRQSRIQKLIKIIGEVDK